MEVKIKVFLSRIDDVISIKKHSFLSYQQTACQGMEIEQN